MAPMYAWFALIGVSALCIPAAFLASLVASGFAQYALTALVLALFVGPMLIVILHFAAKVTNVSDQAMSTLERQLKDAVQSSEHERRLANALEMAEGEPEVLEVVERSLRGNGRVGPHRAAARRQQPRAPDPHGDLVAHGRASELQRRLARPVPGGAPRPGATLLRQRSARRVPETSCPPPGALRGDLRSRVDHGSHRRCHPRDV